MEAAGDIAGPNIVTPLGGPGKKRSNRPRDDSDARNDSRDPGPQGAVNSVPEIIDPASLPNKVEPLGKVEPVSPVSSSWKHYLDSKAQISPVSSLESGTHYAPKKTRREAAGEEERRQHEDAGEERRRRKAAKEERLRFKAAEEGKRRREAANEEDRRRVKDVVSSPEEPKYTAFAEPGLNGMLHGPQPESGKYHALVMAENQGAAGNHGDNGLLSFSSGLPYLASEPRSRPATPLDLKQDSKISGALGSRKGMPDPARPQKIAKKKGRTSRDDVETWDPTSRSHSADEMHNRAQAAGDLEPAKQDETPYSGVEAPDARLDNISRSSNSRAEDRALGDRDAEIEKRKVRNPEAKKRAQERRQRKVKKREERKNRDNVDSYEIHPAEDRADEHDVSRTPSSTALHHAAPYEEHGKDPVAGGAPSPKLSTRLGSSPRIETRSTPAQIPKNVPSWNRDLGKRVSSDEAVPYKPRKQPKDFTIPSESQSTDDAHNRTNDVRDTVSVQGAIVSSREIPNGEGGSHEGRDAAARRSSEQKERSERRGKRGEQTNPQQSPAPKQKQKGGADDGVSGASRESSPSRLDYSADKTKKDVRSSSNDDLYALPSDSEPPPGHGQTSRKGRRHDAAKKDRNASRRSSTLGSDLATDVEAVHFKRRGSEQDLLRPPKATGRVNSEHKSKRERNTSGGLSLSDRSREKRGDLSDSDDDEPLYDPSASRDGKWKSATPPTPTKEPLVGLDDLLNATGKPFTSTLPLRGKATVSPAKPSFKSWIGNVSAQPLGFGIILALAAVGVLGFGSGGSGGSGLTSLAGGGIFLVALAALGLWAWYKNGIKLDKQRDTAAAEDTDPLEGGKETADGDNKRKDDGCGDSPSDSDDDDKEGKGGRKGKHSRNLSDGEVDGHDRNRATSEKCHLLHQQAEDRALELFPGVQRDLVLNALEDYTRAPWPKPEDSIRSIKILKKAAKEIWKEENPHERDYSKHFEPFRNALEEEARKLFAGLLSCSGAYLSGNLLRVELMAEAPMAIRVTAFPGERLFARPGGNREDGVKQSFHREKQNWFEGLTTLCRMKKGWDKLMLLDLSEMPPIEIVCIRPPADFTPNEFERIKKLRVGSPEYKKEKYKFARACSVQRKVGDYAQGDRREWLLKLFEETLPFCLQPDFLPHLRCQAEELGWNDLSSTSTLRHIPCFGDVIEAIQDYMKRHELGMLDVGPCIPLAKDGIRTEKSLLKKVAGKISFRELQVQILRLGLGDPSKLRQGGFSEANEVARTMCDPAVGALDLFQPRPDVAARSFLLETVNKEQVETFKEHVESDFTRWIIDNVVVAEKILSLMKRAHYALPGQRPCPRIWPERDECRKLDERLAARLQEMSVK
ncbi:hypothetical protein QFC21_006599 [Naganishia friedmannii]|uniref:Uncharacterized protein n=1 Tax=Naganishia friedmannii TaxID=89922 RepID=A0ACC2V0X1_9TREE|nr:hypothetical protein QFC21_006599 [Naganishia friedmannii]